MRVLGILVLLLAHKSNADCEADVQDFFDGLSPGNLQQWALQMFDSSSKTPNDGILDGSFLIQLGNYDECLAVRGPPDSNGKARFKGQYCFYQLGFAGKEFDVLNETIAIAQETQQNLQQILKGPRYAKPLMTPFLWAVCAPSSCGPEGVKKVADFAFGFFASAFTGKANTSVAVDTCYYEGDGSKTLDAGSWALIAFAAALFIWIAFSTSYEFSIPEYNKTGWRVLINAFSLKTTTKDLCKLPKSIAPGQLSCLHGIRVGSTLWVLIGHSYLIHNSWPISNYLSSSYQFLEQWYAAPLTSAVLSVDSFFLMSGLLTAYVPLMDLKKGRKFNIFKYYVYRYIRITAPLAMVIWYLSTLNVYLGNGPMWYFTAILSKSNCQENWWATFLYITNYFFSGCLGPGWYLNVDMQLALLAPILLYPLMKWPKYGLGAIAFLTLASMSACFAVTYIEGLPWLLTFKPASGDSAKFLSHIYQNTPMRAVPYLVGMALGYILSERSRVPLPKWAVLLGWLLSATLCLATLFVGLIPNSIEYKYDRLDAAFYAGFHKLGWSLGLAWVVWACVNGHGGFVNRILSWRYFLPLSKLSFAAYLVHQDWMQFKRGLRRTSNYMSHLEVWFDFCAHLIFVLPMSVTLYLAVEAPLMALMRQLFKKKNTVAKHANDQKNN